MRYSKHFFVLIIVFLPFTSCNSAIVENEQNTTESEIRNSNEQIEIKQETVESPEEKAVRLAEEFIKRNGYADAPADKNNLSHETVEFYKNIDELLQFRHNTLEPKAYGIFYRGRLGDKNGWTIIFRYSKRIRDELKKTSKLVSNPNVAGRAVTMNENFENLLVEHKDFPLGNVEKKLQWF